jgi:hypothetical protein
VEICEDDGHCLRLSPRLSVGGPMPCVSVQVDLASNGFCGTLEEVAFEHAELSRFLADLDHLERDRRGSAALSAMSPREFDLKIEVIDRLGHVLLTAELTRYLYEIGGRLAPHHVSVGFSLDPALLPAIVRDFRELLAFRRPRPSGTLGSP